MRQRVAIARTLAAGSEVLLMDEPFGALDAQRRENAAGRASRASSSATRKTIIFVTHDVEEAAFLGRPGHHLLAAAGPGAGRIRRDGAAWARAAAGAARHAGILRAADRAAACSCAPARRVRHELSRPRRANRSLITGASRGIGLGIARPSSAPGADLSRSSRTMPPVDGRAAHSLGARGLRRRHLDEAGDVAGARTQIRALDVLVNNAGLERMTPLDDASRRKRERPSGASSRSTSPARSW